jgi:hypothetical protein
VTAFAVIGHWVATDGEWPDNLGLLDEQVSARLCATREQADRLLTWFPDGYVVEVAV